MNSTILKKSTVVFLVFIFVQFGLPQNRGINNTTSSPFVRLKSVDIGDVKWTDGFWADKFKTASEVTLPTMWQILQDPETSHAWTNFRIVAGLEEGEFKGTPWYDGDLYKWLESVAYVYAQTKDPKLDELMDNVIEIIGKAQAGDGYLTTFIQIGKGKWTWGEGGESPYLPYEENIRWSNYHRHELYNMGHLMTTGCIHYRVTGKTSLLKVAQKTGDYLYETFKSRDPKLAHFGFNPSNIMGAVELYRTTGEARYLELAQIFVDMRGSQPGGTDQNQTRTPLRDEYEAVGHAVTAAYLYCGATDVYAETGEEELLNALNRIWENIALQKMYITGGTCAVHVGVTSSGDKSHEAFGREYELPNASAYNETCANIAFGMWNWRMLGITGDARYADILEKVLYNSGISGISLDGRHYCYTNNLRWHGKNSKLLKNDTYTRLSYLGCYCCPPNVFRTIVNVSGYAYSISNNAVWINIYGNNELSTEFPDGTPVNFIQESQYPWNGLVTITYNSSPTKEFSLFVRIPSWCESATIQTNGKETQSIPKSGQYFELNRSWKKGDIVELNLSMNPQLMAANPLVEETRNQIAVQRGPVVYCLESKDLPQDVKVSEIMIPHNIQLKARYDSAFLRGITVLEGTAKIMHEKDWSGKLYKSLSLSAMNDFELMLIPYFAWNNRGVSSMTVWMPLTIMQ